MPRAFWLLAVAIPPMPLPEKMVPSPTVRPKLLSVPLVLVRFSVPRPATVTVRPPPKSVTNLPTVSVPPLATVHVWLAATPTLALMVLVPLVFAELMPLPATLLFASVASMVSILVPPMVTPPVRMLKFRLLMLKSTSSTLVVRRKGVGFLVAKVTLVW